MVWNFLLALFFSHAHCLPFVRKLIKTTTHSIGPNAHSQISMPLLIWLIGKTIKKITDETSRHNRYCLTYCGFISEELYDQNAYEKLFITLIRMTYKMHWNQDALNGNTNIK